MMFLDHEVSMRPPTWSIQCAELVNMCVVHSAVKTESKRIHDIA